MENGSNKPNAARIYAYILGGAHNFAGSRCWRPSYGAFSIDPAGFDRANSGAVQHAEEIQPTGDGDGLLLSKPHRSA